MMRAIREFLPVFLLAVLAVSGNISAQTPDVKDRQKVRTVSVPISIFTKEELAADKAEEFIQVDRLIVKEDREEQTILSIRSVSDAPLSLAVLIQEDLTANLNLQLKDLATFIKRLPKNSRVMIAYMRGGSLQVRQRFTDDLAKAADSLRIVTSNSAAAPRSPYDSLADALDRFDALPAGRRAVLMVSDGLDLSNGPDSTLPGQSIDLDRAILKAQRKSVAVFTIYSPTAYSERADSRLVLNGQGSLQKLCDETGGRAFFQGTIAPITFEPFFRDISILLNRQFLLSYLSTHMKKGYHKIEITSTNPTVKIEHPKGYYYR